MQEVLSENVEKNKKEIRQNKKDNNELFERMDKRMERLKSEMKSSTLLNTQSNILRKSLDFQPTRIISTEDPSQLELEIINTPAIGETPTKTTATKNNNSNDKDTEHPPAEKQQKFTSSWANQVADQLTQAANSIAEGKSKPKYKTTKDIDREIKRKNDGNLPEERKMEKPKHSGMKAIQKWFGDDSSEEESTDTDNEEGHTEWDGKIDRTSKNIEKKKRQQRNRTIKQHRTAEKARHIKGVGPISSQSINYYMKKCKNNPEKAKREAVNEYLQFFLDYSQEEIDCLSIQEISISAKGDGIVYIAFQNLEDIHELHTRIAECQNPVIATRNFIPPQFYNKYMYISKACNELRKEYPTTKTQIRFGPKDIEVLTKEKDTEEPYKVIDLEKILDICELPGFDHSKIWKTRTERPPRRKAEYSNNRKAPPSHDLTSHPISRNSSTSSAASLPRKKQRMESTPHINTETDTADQEKEVTHNNIEIDYIADQDQDESI